MNYIKQVNTFYKLLSNNPLSSNAQCLYFFLLNKNNELGWIKEFTTANSIVMGFTNLNITALQRARNELKQKGYIDYKKGIGNNAGTYRILELEQQSEQQYAQQYEQQSEQQTDSNMHTLIKQNKTKQEETKNSCINFYMENINPLITPHEVEIINDYCNNLSDELIIYAMKDAIEHKATNMKYIKSILSRYIKNGIKTVKQVEAQKSQSKKEETEEERTARKVRELEALINESK